MLSTPKFIRLALAVSAVFLSQPLTSQAVPAYWDNLAAQDQVKHLPSSPNNLAFSKKTQRTERFFSSPATTQTYPLQNTAPTPTHSSHLTNRSTATIPTNEVDRYTLPNLDYRSVPRLAPPNPIQAPSPSAFSVYQKTEAEIPEHLIIRSQDTLDGLAHQAEYLRRNTHTPYLIDKGLGLSHARLTDTVKALQTWLSNDHARSLKSQFDLYQLEEKDNPGRVRFTGYYTEILAAKRKPDTQYRYPVYGLPGYLKPLPSRNAINQGVLRGKNLELGWVKDRIGLYFMQLQGSGYLRFDDDSTQLLSFAAKNKHPYNNIGRYMSERGYLPLGKITNELVRRWLEAHPKRIDEMLNTNPSYVFFKRSHSSVMTAAQIPATTGHTLSVDTDYIPFGSVLLAKVPLKDTEGKLKGYDWRLLFPQDRGTAVEGPGHIDLYMGAGPEARKKSAHLSLYGTVYILLKKP